MKINPFEPFAPVNPGCFVGRLDELRRLKSALVQTTAGKPANFMITGERGIGKTSLLNYLKYAAEGLIPVDGVQQSFIVIDTDLDENTTQLGLMGKIQLGLEKALSEYEAAREFIKKAWGFVQRIEAGGVKLGQAQKESDELLLDQFAYSLAETTNRVCADAKTGELWGNQINGILILIDEADNGSKKLQLGSFFKLLAERLQRRSCNRVMFGLAGLPDLRKVLHDSHPSSLRIFEELVLDRLSEAEVNSVINLCLEDANRRNPIQTTIDESGRNMLVLLSEGYPHFIQQFGYSAFVSDSDDVIDRGDVIKGAFGPRGALEQIGDRYYRDDFYNKIQKESYRQILRIMADNLDGWVSKKEIRKKFKGSATNLDNAIKALRDRKIILSKEGELGTYRLQHKGFAVWITSRTSTPAEIERTTTTKT
jgi:AAA+ ATPase superfamily predicted ATPase